MLLSVCQPHRMGHGQHPNLKMNMYGSKIVAKLTIVWLFDGVPYWLGPIHHNGPLTRYINYGLRMCRECLERFPRHQLQRKPLVSNPDMHPGTCVTHVSCCMSGSLTYGGGKNVPGIPGACATRNFTYLARGPLRITKVKSPLISVYRV